MAQTTKDLAEADRKRREEFKQHEMEVKFEEQEQLKRKSIYSNQSDVFYIILDL